MSITRLCGILVLFIWALGYAETALAEAPVTDSSSYSNVVFEIERLLSKGAANLASGTVPFAEKILAYIALFLVLRLGVISLLSTFEGAPVMGYMFKSLIEISLLIGMLLFFVQNYGLVTGAFSSFFSEFEAALGIQGKEGLSRILSTLWQSIVHLYDGTIMVNKGSGDGLGNALWATVKSIWSTANESGNLLGGLLSLLIIAISKLAIIAFLCWMAFKMAVKYIGTQFSIALGMAVGPVFIAFRGLPATCFVFEGWLKFMIKAHFVKVVLFLILTLAGGVMGLADQQMSAALSQGEFVNTFMSLIAAVTIAYVLMVIVDEASIIAREILDGGGAMATNKAIGSALTKGAITNTASKMASSANVAGKTAAATGQAAAQGTRAMARGVGKTGEAYVAGRTALGKAAVGASMLGAKGTAGAVVNGMASAAKAGINNRAAAVGQMARNAAHTTRAAMGTPLNKPLPKFDRGGKA